MSDPAASRFTPQNKTTRERLSTNTVGLVALSDFRKRRAEVLEQQEREAREAALAGDGGTPDRSQTGTPDNGGSDSASGSGARPAATATAAARKKKQKLKQKQLLSFADDDGPVDDGAGSEAGIAGRGDGHAAAGAAARDPASGDGDGADAKATAKLKANAAVMVVPRAVTKAALRKEATEREALRREFVAVQEAVKATEIAIPFVFYDGTNTPGGIVRMKKGDFAWVFLDKSRKVGAELGHQGRSRRSWARVSVDDLLLVRDTVIIPHHYDFYFFVINRSVGPLGRRLFDYSAEPPTKAQLPSAGDGAGLKTAAAASSSSLPDIKTLEGASDDPTATKVVDRRWYARNKHIYPASTWQEFDPEKDYDGEIRKDTGGNTFFFS